MNIRKAGILISGTLKVIKKSDDIFAPVKEAITNSFDSIKQRQDISNSFLPYINLKFSFSKRINTAQETEFFIDNIIIEDNGRGFYKKGIERWWDLAQDTKKLNNRGTGKIQIFHRFNKIEINSVFLDEDGSKKRFEASWDTNSEFTENITEDLDSEEELKTIVKLTGFYGSPEERDFFTKYIGSKEELKKDIIKRFLLRLFLESRGSELELYSETFLDGKKQYDVLFNKSNIPQPDKTEVITISSEKPKITNDGGKIKVDWVKVEPKYNLDIRRFKLADSEMDSNVISLCSKNIEIGSFPFYSLRKNTSFAGYRYISSISGDLFDFENNVKDTRDGFEFKSKKQVEAKLKENSQPSALFVDEPVFIFQETIDDGINNGLSKVYSDVKELQDEKQSNVIKLANEYGIPLDLAESFKPGINDTDEDIVEKLFETQAKRSAKKSMEIHKTYKELRDLNIEGINPIDKENCEDKFSELSSKLLDLIPQQNKNDLAGYVIRRDILVKTLKLATSKSLGIQRKWEEDRAAGRDVRTQHEAIIHDILFKRKSQEGANDLWVFDEEFVHFEGCSDVALENIEINGEKLLQDDIDIFYALEKVGIDKKTYLENRPDVLLFPQEGRCVIFEFKAPDIDLSDNTNQIPRYARLIANFSREKGAFKQFYGFLVGNKIDKVNIDPQNWIKVSYGKDSRVGLPKSISDISEFEIPIATLNQEMLLLSEVADRAEIRNRSFADKLGLEEIILTHDD